MVWKVYSHVGLLNRKIGSDTVSDNMSHLELYSPPRIPYFNATPRDRESETRTRNRSGFLNDVCHNLAVLTRENNPNAT